MPAPRYGGAGIASLPQSTFPPNVQAAGALAALPLRSDCADAAVSAVEHAPTFMQGASGMSDSPQPLHAVTVVGSTVTTSRSITACIVPPFIDCLAIDTLHDC